MLLDIARAGTRFVAVGDRGHILYSDDSGRQWTQAAKVPTRVLLTAVCFFDARHGIAVGHDQVILTSSDAGATWLRSHSAPESQKPLLDVWCGKNGHAIAVGAYAGYFSSHDQGAHWQEQIFQAQPLPAKQGGSPPAQDPGLDDDAGGGFHLNHIAAASDSTLYIAGEAGHLYRSEDLGLGWRELPSPYEGSFFGILPLEGETLLAYGLRGHLFRSDDAGLNWTKIDTGTTALLNDAVRMAGDVAIVGLSGVVLTSADSGRHFTLHPQNDRRGLSAVLPSRSQEWVAVGEAGVKTFSQPP